VWRYDPPTARSADRPARPGPLRGRRRVVPHPGRGELGHHPAPFLGKGAYLLDVQGHYATGDSETVEGGQLVLLTIDEEGHRRH
jgi:hypothetical protein